jgi:putative glutamine amidotransferase
VLSTFGLRDDQPRRDDLDVLLDLDPEDPSPLTGAAGLVLPGGGDLDPSLYGQEPHPQTSRVSRRRDIFEMTMLAAALREGIPVLAICKGMQTLNVYLGGTLDQHLADDPRRLAHDRDRPRAEPAHLLHLVEDCKLTEIFGTQDLQVNSHHHQGLDEVAESLRPVGWAEDGVLEAVESREYDWVIGVQWHPEAMAPVDELQADLFEAFVGATAGVRTSDSATARSA